MSVWGVPLQFWNLGKYRYKFYRYVLEIVCRKLIKKNSVILDAGCGEYISSISVLPTDVTVMCIDISKKNIRKSHKLAKNAELTNYAYLQCSVTNLPFKGNTFDLVFSVDAIEHVLDNKKMIRETYRICKKSGCFVGTTSNILNPVLMLDSFFPKLLNNLAKKFAGEHHYERHTRLSPKELLIHLSCSSFKKTSMQFFGYPLFKASHYQFSKKKLPVYAYFWIAFNKITDKGVLKYLKEAVVFCSEK